VSYELLNKRGSFLKAQSSFMKIALAQLNYHIGNFELNVQKIIKTVEEAKTSNADIVVFAELAVCGYPARDFLEFDDFLKQCEKAINDIAAHAHDIAIIVGAPTRNPRIEGKDLFNSAYFLANGKVQQVQHKTLLPTYDIFDEYRYFEPATEWKVIEYKNTRIALVVCEDMWNVGNDNPLYTVCPLDEMMSQKPEMIINISASPFAYDHAAERLAVMRNNTDRYKLPLFYVNHVGAQTDIIFDGASFVISPNSELYDELPYFVESVRVYDVADVIRGRGRDVACNVSTNYEQPKNKTALIHDALILGLRDYFAKMNLKTAILGLSGGIDSAVVVALAAEALGAQNVRVVLLPSQFSSDHSINDARALAKNLNVQYDIVPIEPMFKSYETALSPHFLGTQFNITEENLQARIRGTILMAFSNKFGNILLNTSNKSEMAVGYGTLYGDMCGGISVLGDVYKTEVYELARYFNRNGEVIPKSSIEKPPSAELRPNQKDSDSLPDYDILDKLLYQYIERRQGPNEIIAMGFDAALVHRVLRLVNINEFKRKQTAPVLRVSPKAFGDGRRIPIVAKYLS